jgi:hypothetical protein
VKISNATLRILALLLIGIAAGPELGLAIEMTTLLEILGAAAFFMAFSIGARMVLIDLASAFRNYICEGFACNLSRPVMLIRAAPRVLSFGVSVLVVGRFLFELHAGRVW